MHMHAGFVSPRAMGVERYPASLPCQDMPRPFTKLKALDIEELASTVISAMGKEAP